MCRWERYFEPLPQCAALHVRDSVRCAACISRALSRGTLHSPVQPSVQECGFLRVAAQTYNDLQLPPEPWPDPQVSSGPGSMAQPSSSPAQGAGAGGGTEPPGGRKRKEAWQPLTATRAAAQQQPGGQLSAQQQQQQQQGGQQPAAGQGQQGQQGAALGSSPQGPSQAAPAAGGRKRRVSDEQLVRDAFSGVMYVQSARTWRAFIPLKLPVASKPLFVLAHAQPMVAALARDLSAFWRLDILKQPSSKIPPAVLQDRWAQLLHGALMQR